MTNDDATLLDGVWPDMLAIYLTVRRRKDAEWAWRPHSFLGLPDDDTKKRRAGRTVRPA